MGPDGSRVDPYLGWYCRGGKRGGEGGEGPSWGSLSQRKSRWLEPRRTIFGLPPPTTFLRIKFLSGAFLSLLSMVAYMPFLPTLPNNPFHSILGQQTFLLSLETHSFLTLNYVCRNEAFLSRLQCYNSFRYFPAGAYLSSFPTWAFLSCLSSLVLIIYRSIPLSFFPIY